MDDKRGLMADREPASSPSTGDLAKEAFDALTGLDRLAMAPVLIGGGVLGLVIFIGVAAALGVVVAAVDQLLHPTGAIGAALGLGWFGGSLLITALLLRTALRRINDFLRRRGRAPLY